MDSILFYCRPRDTTCGDALRAWLEHEATKLSDQPGVHRSAVVDLATRGPKSPCGIGWLLECELTDSRPAPTAALSELLTDMRLVGLEPDVFVRKPQSE